MPHNQAMKHNYSVNVCNRSGKTLKGKKYCILTPINYFITDISFWNFLKISSGDKQTTGFLYKIC